MNNENDPNKTDPAKNPAALETLQGGAHVTIKQRNGNVSQIFVRQLPVSLYRKYLESMDHEDQMAELLCAMPKGWADSLTFESHELIISEGERLNAHFFGQWLERMKRRQALLAPEMQDRIAQALASRLPATS